MFTCLFLCFTHFYPNARCLQIKIPHRHSSPFYSGSNLKWKVPYLVNVIGLTLASLSFSGMLQPDPCIFPDDYWCRSTSKGHIYEGIVGHRVIKRLRVFQGFVMGVYWIYSGRWVECTLYCPYILLHILFRRLFKLGSRDKS